MVRTNKIAKSFTGLEWVCESKCCQPPKRDCANPKNLTCSKNQRGGSGKQTETEVFTVPGIQVHFYRLLMSVCWKG